MAWSPAVSVVFFFIKRKLIGVFKAGEAWLWLGLPRSLSFLFFFIKISDWCF